MVLSWSRGMAAALAAEADVEPDMAASAAESDEEPDTGPDMTAMAAQADMEPDMQHDMVPQAAVATAEVKLGLDVESLGPSGSEPCPADMGPARHWVEPMLASMRQRREACGEQLRPLVVTSGCSGTHAEGKVLTWLGIDAVYPYTCERKTAAQTFMQKNGPRSDHNFIDVGMPAQGGGFCVWHQQRCRVPDARSDLFVAGWPCQPHSTQNAKRFKPGGVSSHPMYSVGDMVVQHLATQNPRAAILENVMGITMSSTSAAGFETPPELGTMLSKIKKIPSLKDPRRSRFAARAVEQDLNVWIEGARARTAQHTSQLEP